VEGAFWLEGVLLVVVVVVDVRYHEEIDVNTDDHSYGGEDLRKRMMGAMRMDRFSTADRIAGAM
jgi:hypothetical protein